MSKKKNDAEFCPDCMSEMYCLNPDTDADHWRCPHCGTTGTFFDGGFCYDSDDDMPACCAACGNTAYPRCKTSCPIFDD